MLNFRNYCIRNQPPFRFPLVTIWLCNFWRKKIGVKAARKMLLKLITGEINKERKQKQRLKLLSLQLHSDFQQYKKNHFSFF